MKATVMTVAVLAACAASAMTAKTSWTQRWPWETKVDIDFTLEGEGKCDVSVTANFTTNGVPGSFDLERAGLEGSVWELRSGCHRLVWDPAAAGFAVGELKDFSVSVTPVEDPLDSRAWLVWDIASGTYAYCASNAAPVDANGWPWQDNVYKSAKMVFRRIPSGTFTMGYTKEQLDWLKQVSMPSKDSCVHVPAHPVELTSDYYIGIYEVTRGQINRIHDPASTSASGYPWHSTSQTAEPALYPLGGGVTCFLRGSNAVDNINWPTTKFRVKPGTWIDKARKRAGGRLMIDLPTASQWQRAARPDSDVFWYAAKGKNGVTTGGGKVGDSAQSLSNVLAVISQVIANVGISNQYGQPNTCGMYAPNSFGIYDTVGTRIEHVLDQYKDAETIAAETIDPVGPTSAPKYNVVFNSFIHHQSLLGWSMETISTTFKNRDLDYTNINNAQLFRFAIHLRPPQSFEGKWE